MENTVKEPSSGAPSFDHGAHVEFLDYYAQKSLSETSLQRMRGIIRCVLRKAAEIHGPDKILDVADVGCGAGTLSLLWAGEGHRAHGLDVNEALIEVAQKRAADAGFAVDFRLGSATRLPWPDRSMDVCIAPELLEHVADWQSCLNEFCRILKPKGILYITTSNCLCPKQEEFNLPLYSWYPGFLKRYFEKAAVTTHPEYANYATYPAVNWFSFYQLKKELAKRGLTAFDRFDIMDTSTKSPLQKRLLKLIRATPLTRFLGHVASQDLTVLGVRGN